MHARSGWIVSALLGAVLGYGIGWRQHPPAAPVASDCPAREARVDPAPAQPAVPASSVATVDVAGLREELRQLLREELRREAARPAPEREPESPSAESLAAQARGSRLVSDALAQGRWSDRDKAELLAVLPQLPAEHRDDLLHKLLPAINSGALRVETSGMPF